MPMTPGVSCVVASRLAKASRAVRNHSGMGCASLAHHFSRCLRDTKSFIHVIFLKGIEPDHEHMINGWIFKKEEAAPVKNSSANATWMSWHWFLAGKTVIPDVKLLSFWCLVIFLYSDTIIYVFGLCLALVNE